jgi:MazG family protein
MPTRFQLIRTGPQEELLAGENLRKLVELTARLRGPQGCPWDREQSFNSLKPLLLEEAYEVVDEVNAGDWSGLEDELGDVLFLVVFYSRLAEEEGRFTIESVIDRVHSKLIRRHPHVFGDVQARDAGEALASWRAVKEQEKAAKPAGKSILDGIARSLPSTLVAQELGVRAAEVGFEWPSAEAVLDKVEEEVRELRKELAARKAEQSARIEDEVGDLLFAVANLARFLGSDAESGLRRGNRKFERRFRELEQEVERRGKKLRECSLEEMESIWNDIKISERT